MEQLLQIKTMVSGFESFLPNLLNYLQNLCNTFKAGQVAAHFAAWRTLTSDKVLLSDVLGASIECTATPVQHRLPNQTFSMQEYPIVCQEVHKLLEKGVITKVSPRPGQILSSIFLRPKKDGSHRLILNLKRFNEAVRLYHFKMDSLSTITKFVTKNCFMASVDMKDAYYSIPIKSSDRKFLRFIWEGNLYEFTCLPNGLSCAPRIFTKLLKPPLSTLHKQGHIAVAHLDDLYLQGQTYEKCVQNVIDTTLLFDKLGLVVHPEKSIFKPTQVLTILGFVINSVTMTIQLTREKATGLQRACTELLASSSLSIREVASVIGKIVSSFPGVMHGAVYYRHLEKDKSQALQRTRGNFDASMSLSSHSKSELQWWIQNVDNAYNVINHPQPHHQITTDASLMGWGAEYAGVSSGGNWSHSESKHHINYLEMLAILLGLQTFAKNKNNTHIRIMCDNTTAVNVINHMGTSHSDPCNSLAKEIWEWCIVRKIWLSVAHIPGKQNLIADFESRRNQRESEWKLDKLSLFNALERLDFKPDIDLFASRINHQFPKYVSYRPDPEAFAIDAFSLDWSNFNFYAFPPFSVIPTVLKKLKSEGARGVCVLPDWPPQAWYPAVLQLLKQKPVYLKARKDLLQLPSHPKEIHPIWHKLNLFVCLLSGRD